MLNKKNKTFYTSDFSNSKYDTTVGDIYHYTSADGIIGILKNKELWLTNIYFLNDNQEMFYTYKLVKTILSEIKKQLDKNFVNNISNRINYILSDKYFKNENKVWAREEFYIASFSLDDDSLSLWNYYTKTNKTGYNLSFKDYMFKKHTIAQGKVCYNTDEQRQMLIDTILKHHVSYKKAKNNNEKSEIMTQLFYNFIIYSLFFKAKKFEIEKEYRIVMPILTSTSEEENKCYYREKNGLIIPYIKFDLENLKRGFQEYDFIVDKITISPLNNGEITRYGVSRLAHCAGLYDCKIVFSEANMKY